MPEKKLKKKIVYKITYPNGKIYIGKDLVYNINYFGSANGEIIAEDFPWEEQQAFVIKKEILWSSDDATDQEVNSVEVEFIRKFKANNPTVGYNRWPKYGDK
jgi:hypothetical protein